MSWSDQDLKNDSKSWTQGIFEFSAEDPLGTIMLVWIVGDAAREADKLDDEIIKKDIGEVLNEFLGRDDISPPDYLYR